MSTLPDKKEIALSIEGTEYTVQVRQKPFCEGVELSCRVEEEMIRVQDRGLGCGEALRLLEVEIIRFLTQGYTNEI